MGRPPIYTEAERREKRRIKQAKWRAENLERAREITRLSEERRRHAVAIAEGRDPRKPGVARRFTEEEKRAKRLAKSKAYYHAHRDELKAKRDAGKLGATAVAKSDLSPDELARRAKANEKVKRWRTANPERAKEITRKSERNRRERQAAAEGRTLRQWGNPLPEADRLLRDRAISATRRTRIRGNGGKFTRHDIAEMRATQKGICPVCSIALGDEVHVDHWVPVVLGGSSDPGNLRLLHPACNLKKGARHPNELGLPG